MMAIAAALLAAGCGDSGKETLVLPSGGVLTGTWNTGCLDTGSSTSTEVEAVVRESTLELSEDHWEQNDTCSATANYTSATTETLGFTGTQELAAGGLATRLELTLTDDTLTPRDQATADAWNSSSLFGFTDWAPGVAKSTLGLDQDGSTVEVTLQKDVFAINDSEQPNELYIGLDEQDGGDVDADGYPTSLDTSLVLLRQ